MIAAGLLTDASAASVGPHHAKERSTTPGQTEASAEAWAADGSPFITPAGWKGTWTIHGTLRKSRAVFTLPAYGEDH